jgi:hypothetical protein
MATFSIDDHPVHDIEVLERFRTRDGGGRDIHPQMAELIEVEVTNEGFGEHSINLQFQGENGVFFSVELQEFMRLEEDGFIE